MDVLSSELSLLASLLSTPDLDTKEAILELVAYYPWLQPAAQELEQLPVEVWQAEYKRLFTEHNVLSSFTNDMAYFNTKYYKLPLQNLKRMYKRMGLRLTDTSSDYLSILLECVAYLNSNPTHGKEFWDELWHEHLAYWIPGFCQKLQRESRLIFYRVIANRLYILLPKMQRMAAAAA